MRNGDSLCRFVLFQYICKGRGGAGGIGSGVPLAGLRSVQARYRRKRFADISSRLLNGNAAPSIPNLQNRIAPLRHVGIVGGKNQNRLRMDERKQNIQNDCRIPGIQRALLPAQRNAVGRIRVGN